MCNQFPVSSSCEWLQNDAASNWLFKLHVSAFVCGVSNFRNEVVMQLTTSILCFVSNSGHELIFVTPCIPVQTFVFTVVLRFHPLSWIGCHNREYGLTHWPAETMNIMVYWLDMLTARQNVMLGPLCSWEFLCSVVTKVVTEADHVISIIQIILICRYTVSLFLLFAVVLKDAVTVSGETCVA